MKSKSDVRSTRNVPPLAPCLPPLDELLDAGDANPALTSRPTPIANATTESQTLLFIALLSLNRKSRAFRLLGQHTSSQALDARPPVLVSAAQPAGRRRPAYRRRGG